MSAEAVGYVYRSSPFSGTTFAVHLAIADSVNDQHDYDFWLSRDKLAKKARASKRATIYALRELEARGFLRRTEDAHFHEPTHYLFLFPESETVYETRGVQIATKRGANSDKDEVQPVHPNPKELQPKLEPKDLSPTSSAERKHALFVALCEATGRDPYGMTPPEERATAVAKEALWKVSATPDEIWRRAENYGTHYDAALTPHALVLHWSLCARPRRAAAAPGEDTWREALQRKEEEEADARQSSLGAGS